jgi:hypothetical protein
MRGPKSARGTKAFTASGPTRKDHSATARLGSHVRQQVASQCDVRVERALAECRYWPIDEAARRSAPSARVVRNTSFPAWLALFALGHVGKTAAKTVTYCYSLRSECLLAMQKNALLLSVVILAAACTSVSPKSGSPRHEYLGPPSDKGAKDFAECVQKSLPSHGVTVAPPKSGVIYIEGDVGTMNSWRVGAGPSLIGGGTSVIVTRAPPPESGILPLLVTCL